MTPQISSALTICLYSIILLISIPAGKAVDILDEWDWERNEMFETDDHAREHIKEDLENIGIKDTENLTDDEINLHYFKLHDFDENMKLDGLELLQAFLHHAYENNAFSGKTDEEREKILQSYTITIDEILKTNDRDQDGYMTYVEFKLAQGETKNIRSDPQ